MYILSNKVVFVPNPTGPGPATTLDALLNLLHGFFEHDGDWQPEFIVWLDTFESYAGIGEPCGATLDGPHECFLVECQGTTEHFTIDDVEKLAVKNPLTGLYDVYYDASPF